MPIHEYECRACGSIFEQLVRAQDTPACPFCQSPDLDRLVSGFAVSSEGTRDSALQAARRRSVQNRNQRDQQHAEVEDTLEHLKDDYGIDAAKPLAKPRA